MLSGETLRAQSSADAIEKHNLAARYQKLEQFDLALAEWKKLAKEHPEDELAASAWHQAGVCSFQLGKFGDAVKSFDTFLKKYPQHELAEATLTNSGLASYNLAQAAKDAAATAAFKQAIATFDKQREQFPEGKLLPRSNYYRAESFTGLGDTKSAVAAYREWLKNHAEDPLAADVRLALSAALNETGEASEAIKSLETLLSSKPEAAVAAEATLRLGDALSAAGRFKEAASRFKEAIAAGETMVDIDYARRAMASAQFNAGDYKQAAATYEQVGDSASAGKSLYQAKDYAAASEQLAKAYEAKPKDADLAHWWVRALLEAGMADKALASAEGALAKTTSPELMLAKADAMYAMDDQRAASVAIYTAAAEAADGELAAEGHYYAAATALELGQLDVAKAEAQKVLDKYGDSTYVIDSLSTLAEAQLQSGQAKEAAESFAKLLESADDSKQLAWSVRRAWALSTAGDEAAVITTIGPLAAKADSSDGQQALFLLGRANYRTKDYAKAIEALMPVASLDPPTEWTPESKLITARSQAASGDHDAAITTFTGLINLKPAADMLAQAHYRRGESNEQQGKADAAVADYDQVAKTKADHPLVPYAGYRAARLLFESDKGEEAAARFAKLAEQFPDHQLAREGLMGQASSLAQAGKHQQALDVLAKMDQNSPQVALAKGTSLAGLEKWDEAIAALTLATAAEGDFADRDQAWYELGWANREAGKSAEARQAFTKLANDFADSSLALDATFRVGESHYEAGEFAEAATWFTKAANEKSESNLQEKSQHMLAWSQFKQGQNQEAAASFAKQLEAHPNGQLKADGKWMKGESLFAAEDYEKALAAYTEAKSEQPTAASLAPLGMLHAGQAAGQLKKWQESADWLKQATSKYPDYSGRNEMDYELGWALSKLKKSAEAMPLLTKVADGDKSPLGARARFVIGELEFADKKYEQAVRSFFQVAYGYGDRQAPEAYHTWQAESLFEAARCLEQLDRSSAAVKVYAELVERFTDHPKAELARKRLEALGAT